MSEESNSKTSKKINEKAVDLKNEIERLKEDRDDARKERDYFRDAVRSALSHFKSSRDMDNTLTDEERAYIENRWQRAVDEAFKQQLQKAWRMAVVVLSVVSAVGFCVIGEAVKSLAQVSVDTMLERVKKDVKEMVVEVATARKEVLTSNGEAKASLTQLESVIVQAKGRLKEADKTYNDVKLAVEADALDVKNKTLGAYEVAKARLTKLEEMIAQTEGRLKEAEMAYNGAKSAIEQDAVKMNDRMEKRSKEIEIAAKSVDDSVIATKNFAKVAGDTSSKMEASMSETIKEFSKQMSKVEQLKKDIGDTANLAIEAKQHTTSAEASAKKAKEHADGVVADYEKARTQSKSTDEGIERLIERYNEFAKIAKSFVESGASLEISADLFQKTADVSATAYAEAKAETERARKIMQEVQGKLEGKILQQLPEPDKR